MAGKLTRGLRELRHAWNAFTEDTSSQRVAPFGSGSYGAPQSGGRMRFGVGNERSIVTAIYTRMAVDCASVPIRHIRRDEQNRYTGDVDSHLNDCLRVEANVDQSAFAFFIDLFQSLFEDGYAAIVPVDTTLNPNQTGGWDVNTMRVGEIVQWHKRHVTVNVWNIDLGQRQPITLDKRNVAIIYNPLYSIMNEPNSTLQRLIRKLSLLDSVDEQSASGKMDLIIKLPYVMKSEALQQRAADRRREIELQLKDSKYGIAYIDGTEDITQLNRPAENNLLNQVEYLTNMAFGQLGVTPEIMNGTADEAAMLNYYNRSIGPLLEAVCQEIRRKFLTKTARSQGQWVEWFRDPFKLVPMKDLAEMADKLTRNEIVTSNEFRSFMGIKPSADPKADELWNSNMPRPNDPSAPAAPAAPPAEDPATTAALDALDQQLGSMESDLGVTANADGG